MKTVAQVVFFVAVCITSAVAQSPEITVDELTSHVKYLASDELEGRGSGTEGNRKAGAYIAEQFKSYGVKPVGDSGTYFQSFEFVSALKLGAANSFVASPKNGKPRPLKTDEEYRPLGFSATAKVSGPLVFAGYGITAPEKNYDDYKGIDVSGKIVVVLRYGPDGEDMHSDFYKHTAYREKARIARDRGALAMILVDGTEDELLKLRYDQSFATSGIPCVAVQRSILQSWLSMRKKDLKAIQEFIREKKEPVNFELPVKVTLATEVAKVMGRTANILGYLEGNDPVLKEQVVVIGAHFDHLGFGGEGSGSLKPDAHEIHNGADDNASGTSAMLELAQRFSAGRASLVRSMLFIGFSAEEIGTVGSQYYVNNPAFPLNKTVAMMNLDMVGRMKENTITVSGVGTSPIWNDVVKKCNNGTDTLNIKTSPDGFGPSDHMQFYSKDIPVLFFFTGTHGDYHKPSDDWEKLNYEGEQRITKYVYAIANDIQSNTDRPQFTRAAASASMGGGDGRGFSVTLGVVPDYSATVEGMKIDGTRAGGPAEKAGLLAGDVIIRFAGKKVLNIYDYMGILSGLKVGDSAEIEVLRDGKPMTFSATMQKR